MSASTSTEAETQPVHISPEARHVLATKVREWTGWKNGALAFGKTDPKVSPYAVCDRTARSLTVDPEHLILNPNRVLLTVTPFRLRQEAVLTGTLLHEAGHARHSGWLDTQPVHSDGTIPTKQVVALAQTMEEPRVEGLMFAEADRIGAMGLGWTMRATAAHLLPMTEVAADPAQAIMDLIESWALRAGRQIALDDRSRVTGTRYFAPKWVSQFTSLLHQTIEAHLEARVEAGAVLDAANDDDGQGLTETANYRSQRILALLRFMLVCSDDDGPAMIDTARDVIDLLFPETPEDDDSDANDESAMPGDPHAVGAGAQPEPEAGAPEDNEGEGDEAGSDGEGNTEPEDEGSGDDPGAGDSGQDDVESDPGQGEPGEQDSGEGEAQSEALSALAQALADLEKRAKAQIDDEAEDQAAQAPPLESGSQPGGAGPGGVHGGGWRNPTAEERDVARGAEHFLRNLIDVSESSKRSLTDQPSAIVDGAKLAEWKAGGQVREPHFFIRNRRNIEPSPPIKIAILVDVSSSMSSLQAPSALLSWALANAALDLRNFAGRGQQIESCLIHWGDSVRVMQKPGEVLPGLREHRCDQGTSAMWKALDEVETLIPGFFDLGDRPVNRLLVQFTDWQLFGHRQELPRISRALEAGVNMLSVVPQHYTARGSSLPQIIAGSPVQRGMNSLIKYNPGNPGLVWTQAAEMLNGAVPDEASKYGF